MSIRKYLTEQIAFHPSMQYQDIVKLCYQAAHGAEHLLSDINRAKAYLEKEYESTEAVSGQLFEAISDEVCRVNIAAWKAQGLSVELLFQLFMASAVINKNADKLFLEYLSEAEGMIWETRSEEEFAEWKAFLQEYSKAGMPCMHHSEKYREAEHPAYRIIKREYIKGLCEKWKEVKEN